MTYRIISIQHGDYVQALETISKGENESYFGMAHTLDVLGDLFNNSAHSVISINTKEEYKIQKENYELIGLKRYTLPRPIPATITMLLNAKRMCKIIKSFKPTHVLIRTGGIYAWKILEYCTKNNINTLVVFANTFDNPGVKNKFINKKLVSLLNHPCVFRVANHKQPATNSMIDLGVEEKKSLAWDWPNAKHPADYPIKKLNDAGRKNIIYVGSVIYDKGVGDLVDAVKLLLKQGELITLTIIGDGNDFDDIHKQAGSHAGEDILFLGRLSNDKVFQLMLDSNLICVPSRHVFTEGMPLTLTEALASRSPVIISDHPVFKRAFIENEGVCFFPEKKPDKLANVIKNTLMNIDNYKQLSISTLNAFERVECKTTFGDIVMQWKGTFGQ